jgi:hypothetical protein
MSTEPRQEETCSLLPLVRLRDAVSQAEPLLIVLQNRYASSLSADSRSHDSDRVPLMMIREIREALAGCQPNSVLNEPGA